MKQSLFTRLLIYQKERFPLLVHVPLIAAFSFSAISYSRLCREVYQFISWTDYLACVFTNVTLFFILRVSDEYKDRHEDAEFRTYLPVARGLITLRELSIVASVLFSIATVINILFYPPLLLIYLFVIFYLFLMRYEFFAATWLKKRQVWYIISHMIIIPLADVYASSFDWKLAEVTPPVGLLFFFCVSFLNGVVLEIGRKIRTPEKEEPGVLSYTGLWGLKGGPGVWIGVLTANFALALIAARYASSNTTVTIILIALYILTLLPAIAFLLKPGHKATKMIELMSLVWALGMYLTLGAIPFISRLYS